VGVRPGRDPADDLIVVPDRLVADDVGRIVGIRIHREVHHPRRVRCHLGLDGGPPDEVVVELEVAVHSRLERRVDRPVLAEPRAEHLLHPHRHQRPESEQPHPVLLAGLPQQVEQARWYSGATQIS
jgi:hypothetical protein